jgi:hypothetical protein
MGEFHGVGEGAIDDGCHPRRRLAHEAYGHIGYSWRAAQVTIVTGLFAIALCEAQWWLIRIVEIGHQVYRASETVLCPLSRKRRTSALTAV